MGAIGGGLYGSDFACDLRADIADLMRAPLSDDEIIAVIADAHLPASGDHIDAFDYWLVLADQLERRGSPRPQIFERAIEIIEQRHDIAALEELDASSSMRTARSRANAKLLERLRHPRPAKQRRPITRRLPLLFTEGDALAWPTDHGRLKTPYVFGYFEQDGWGFGVVSRAGYRFGVLPTYAVQILLWRDRAKPAAELAAHCRRSDHQFGEVSVGDIEMFEIERLGEAPAYAISPPAPEIPKRLRGIDWGLDAFNKSCANFLKFPHAPPSSSPLFADEPDQRGLPPEVAKELFARKRPTTLPA